MVTLNQQVRGILSELIPEIPAHCLPLVGLSAFYLCATPSDEPNQCIPACVAVQAAMEHYGTQTKIVPVVLKVSWSAESRGSDSPLLHSDGTTNGHFVIVTENDEFVDPTALQFDDLVSRRGTSGFLPMYGRTPGLWSQIVVGNSIHVGTPLDFKVGKNAGHVIYELYRYEDATPIADYYVQLNASKNLQGWQRSMADIFAWNIGNKVLIGERSKEISEIIDLNFKQAVENRIGGKQPEWQQTSEF